MKSVLIFVIAIAAISAQITVKVKEGKRVDLSKTKLSNKFCFVENKIMKFSSNFMKYPVFASTPSQCRSRCRRNLGCQSFEYVPKTQGCMLKANRGVSLINKNGHNLYYRLNKGESCPSGYKLFAPKVPKYSKTFCQVKGKKCPGSNLYRKPQNIPDMKDCLRRCARIATCGSVDIINKKCSPKAKLCKVTELVNEAGALHSYRLLNGEKCRTEEKVVPVKKRVRVIFATERTAKKVQEKRRYNKKISISEYVRMANLWPKSKQRAAFSTVFPPPIVDKLVAGQGWSMDTRGELDCWFKGRYPPRVPCPKEWTK